MRIKVEATWTNLEIVTLSEVKSEKDKYHMITTYLWSL